MNQSKVVYIAEYTTLNLGHQKFAVDIYCKLLMTSVSGSIFAIYTSLPWLIYRIYMACMLKHKALTHFFPLPSQAPVQLQLVPECLVENMANFAMFLR